MNYTRTHRNNEASTLSEIGALEVEQIFVNLLIKFFPADARAVYVPPSRRRPADDDDLSLAMQSNRWVETNDVGSEFRARLRKQAEKDVLRKHRFNFIFIDN